MTKVIWKKWQMTLKLAITDCQLVKERRKFMISLPGRNPTENEYKGLILNSKVHMDLAAFVGNIHHLMVRSYIS